MEGQVLGAVTIVRDVTIRWEQEQALRQRLAAYRVSLLRILATVRSASVDSQETAAIRSMNSS